MTRVAALVNMLRAQGIEVGTATAEIKIGDGQFPAGSYVDQARSAVRPSREEPAREAGLSRSGAHAPTTTAAGRWGYAFNVDVKEINDKAILDARGRRSVKKAELKGKVTGSGTAGSRSRTTARTT